MARSRKKTPIIPNTCADSEKEDKRNNNRKLRRTVKQKLQVVEDTEDLVLPELREITDVWGSAKDGKKYKDPAKLDPKLMRK
jgi:hypothetical protein